MDDGYAASNVRKLHEQGFSQRAIAAQLGISRHRVRTALGDVVTPGVHRRALSDLSSGTVVGGRISTDRQSSGIGSFGAILPHNEAANDLRMDWLDDETISKMPIDKLMEVAANASPELSRGIWDFLIMCMPGFEIQAYQPGTSTEHAQGQVIVDETNRTVRNLYGTEEAMFGRSFLSAAIRGALALETVFANDARTVVDMVAVDPNIVRFKQVEEAERGTVWQKGQLQNGQWVSLEIPTFRYIAVHPFPGKPYGRAPMLPAIWPALFLLGFFQDLRRVISNQGYPRLHFKVKLEGIYEMLTNGEDELEGNVDPRLVTDILNRIVAQAKDSFAGIQPHENFVTSNLVDIESPVGTLGANALGGVVGIIEALERLCVKAMKTMPLMQAIIEGAGEANANRQWEIHAQGLKYVQHLAENLYGPAYELICQAQGVICDVKVRFTELRAAEELRDEQTLALKIGNALELMKAGFKTPNEAAMMAVGEISDAVALAYPNPDGSAKTEAPTMEPSEDADDAEDLEAEPGSNRAQPAAHRAPALTMHGDPRLTVAEFARLVADSVGRANPMLPVVPETVPVTSVDERSATALFDETEPDYAGLLDAEQVEA